MFYRIMNSPPGYALHQRYMVGAYRTLELPATDSVGLNNADGSPFFSSLEDARWVLPAGAKQLPFEPRWQFLELWEASDRDIDQIIEGVKKRLPTVQIEQLRVKSPADDDGLWWFRLIGVKKDIQIESPKGMCPFIVEHDDMTSTSDAEIAHTIDDVVDKVLAYLVKQLYET